MSALNSLALWGGLAAVGVAVPIIIHLLYRKHRRQTDWAAMELLRRALVTRSGQVRLENFLILFLRCLALVLVAAALLRPTLSTESSIGEQNVGMVIAIDASMSMNHGQSTRFEKAISRAKEILKHVRIGEPVTVVLMSNRPQYLLRASGYDPEKFNRVLNNAKATPHRLGLETNLAELEELLSEMKTPQKECYLITDAQQSDWGKLSPKAISTFSRLKSAGNVFVLPVSSSEEENLAITHFGYASGQLHKSGVAHLVARVRNEGRTAQDGGTVEFFVNEALVTRQPVGMLEPGSSVDISFYTSFDGEGDVPVRAKITGDDLSEDNERFVVVHVRPGIRVLCVEDELDDSAGDRMGTYYAVRALRLLSRGPDGPVQVHQVRAVDLSLETLSDYDVVLLANVADLSPEMVRRLNAFVRAGGGMIVFAGEQVQAQTYNTRFGNDLLPAALGPVLEIEDGEKPWTLASVVSAHPLAAMTKRLEKGMRNSVSVSKVVSVKPYETAETVLSLTKNDAPLLLSRKVGAGSVLMFTTSADRSWNALAIHPIYSMLLQQAVTSMTSRPEERNVIVGEQAKLPLIGKQVGQLIQVTDPGNESADIKITQDNQQPIAAFETETAGVYRIIGERGEFPRYLSANVDSAESDIRVASPQALETSLAELGVKVISNPADLGGAIEQGRTGRELSGLLLILGIIVFVVQAILAKYFTNRMAAPDTDVSATLQMSRVVAARRS